jgi:hypothetical protein
METQATRKSSVDAKEPVALSAEMMQLPLPPVP